MTWLLVIKLLVQIAAYLARRSDRADIEKGLLNELEKLQGERVDRAAAARDDVVSGRVPADDADPYRRD